MSRTARTFLGIVAVVAIPGSVALALGFQLGESSKELKLEYDITVYDHTTGRVTVVLTLKDQGRLGPLSSIDFHLPSDEKHDSGGTKSDLTISMATRKEGKSQVGRIHIRKDWASRAEIHLKTNHLDGKQQALTWYYHVIPLKDLIARAEPYKTVK